MPFVLVIQYLNNSRVQQQNTLYQNETMEEQATKQITILIAGRPYPLKIKATDEAAIRKIVQEVNEKANRFQLNYNNKDKQDFLAMTALTYAVELHRLRQIGGVTQDTELLDKLSHVDTLLDQIIDK